MPSRDTRRLRAAYWPLLRRLGVVDDTVRHTIQLRCTGKPSIKAWDFADWRGAVEVLKQFNLPRARQLEFCADLVGEPEIERWGERQWAAAILAVRRQMREPDLPPELNGGASERQLRYLADLEADIAWHGEHGMWGMIAARCSTFKALPEWHRDRLFAERSVRMLPKAVVTEAIRLLTRERASQRRPKRRRPVAAATKGD